jgi:hypothetical protein
MSLGRTFVETDHRALPIRLFSIRVEHIFHAGDELAVDPWDAPHVLAPGLELVFRQTTSHGLAGDVVVLGEPDQFTGQELQRPTCAAFGRVRTGRCDQQGLLFAGELAVGSRARLFAECGLQVAGRHAARKCKRAQILLAADTGAGDEEIARSVGVGGSTVYRTKRRFAIVAQEALEFIAFDLATDPGSDRRTSEGR